MYLHVAVLVSPIPQLIENVRTERLVNEHYRTIAITNRLNFKNPSFLCNFVERSKNCFQKYENLSWLTTVKTR